RDVVELVPGKIYSVGVNNNGSINNQTACLTAQANVEIRRAGKPTTQSGGQARLQWGSWMGKTGAHNRSILRIDNVNNFFLGWTTVHGHKNSINSVTDVVYTEGQDGGITNIVAYGGTNIRMKEVVSTHSLTDGLY